MTNGKKREEAAKRRKKSEKCASCAGECRRNTAKTCQNCEYIFHKKCFRSSTTMCCHCNVLTNL